MLPLHMETSRCLMLKNAPWESSFTKDFHTCLDGWIWTVPSCVILPTPAFLSFLSRLSQMYHSNLTPSSLMSYYLSFMYWIFEDLLEPSSNNTTQALQGFLPFQRVCRGQLSILTHQWENTHTQIPKSMAKNIFRPWAFLIPVVFRAANQWCYHKLHH